MPHDMLNARTMTRAGRLLVLILVLLLAAIVLRSFAASLESRLVFFPYRGEDATPSSLDIPYRQVRLTTSDREQIVGWLLEPERPRADVVYFHGNGGNLSVWLPVLATLHRLDVRVFAIDYRGYGLSTGSPTEEGVYRDAEAAVTWMRDQRTASSPPLVYWGRSLGGPIAASAARHTAPDALILESTFPDKASVILRQPILRALNIFSSYRFPTADLLRDFDRPVLVMHGDRDSIIPFHLGEELFAELGAPKQFIRIRGADHNDFFDASNMEYWEPVISFIDSQ